MIRAPPNVLRYNFWTSYNQNSSGPTLRHRRLPLPPRHNPRDIRRLRPLQAMISAGKLDIQHSADLRPRRDSLGWRPRRRRHLHHHRPD